MWTTCPSFTGETKWRASIEAVTTTLRAWRPAAIAAAISTQLTIWPPKIVPSALVCEGSTISVIVTADSDGTLPFALLMSRSKIAATWGRRQKNTSAAHREKDELGLAGWKRLFLYLTHS